MEHGIEIGSVAAHVDLDGRLLRCCKEARPVVAGLRDGGLDRPGGVVDPVVTRGEPAPVSRRIMTTKKTISSNVSNNSGP